MTSLDILVTHGWDDYALLDSGDGRKLELYGPYRFIRPEAQALRLEELPTFLEDIRITREAYEKRAALTKSIG